MSKCICHRGTQKFRYVQAEERERGANKGRVAYDVRLIQRGQERKKEIILTRLGLEKRII